MIATKDVVELVLDADQLSELAGMPVRAHRIRIKPDTSVIVGLSDQTTGEVRGWARLLWPASHAKADKVRRRSAQLGLPIRERHLTAGLLLQAGDVVTDPALGKRLHRSQAIDWPRTGTLPLLRYNPLRRVVARDQDRVVRVMARADSLSYPMHELLAPQVAVPDRLDDGSDPHAVVQCFTGGADLAHAPSLELARAAGAQLAALHRVKAGRFAAPLATRAPSVARQAEAHAELLDHLAPELAKRLRGLAAQVSQPEGEPVIVHGDFSADQVLHDGSQVWLTDFDRVALAPPALDLGSFAAVAKQEETQALLDGYQAAGGQLPNQDQVRRAELCSAVLRLADSLRAAEVNWRDDIVARMDAIEGKLS